ncbi:MAG: hypothetical protein IPJ65_09080 [Archangiaceae bacterium]|nr:hypothetical protein [Archangiaceae bacterium]
MSTLVVGSSLKEFFRLVVGEAVKSQRVSLAEVTEFYLVNLLSDFAQAEKLAEAEPLAVLYHKALQADREERVRTLRRLGDLSLYTAGFFKESLKDRVVGPDYYMQMGQNAYAAVAQLSRSSSFSSVYWELNQKFTALTEVLEEIAARGQCATPSGQVRVLESFGKSGSEHLERVLLDVGLIPKGVLPN